MNPTPIDLLIENGTVFTLDPQRRVLDNASVAVDGDRIVAVGDAAEMRARYAPRQTINAHRKAVLPGLIDSHAHAGHGMLRTMGTGGDAGAWMKAAAQVYTEASDEHFWHAEAALASLEKSGQAYGWPVGDTGRGGWWCPYRSMRDGFERRIHSAT